MPDLMRGWRSVVFAPAGDGQRRRRGTDGARLDSGPSLTITRLQQVEHEVFLTLRAGAAGVAVPGIAEAGTAGPASGDTILVDSATQTVVLTDFRNAIADATAAVFIQRLFTSYLPPIWGWATLVWMRKREYL
jgi:hypothetical protein